MRAIVTRARQLSGELRVPGDKSISHRAVLFGALAQGTTDVRGLAPGADVRSSLACAQALGVQARWTGRDALTLQSPGRDGWNRGEIALDAGNSGTTARLLMGMLAPTQGLTARLHGDPSLSRRPMRRVQRPLAQMGARIQLTDAGTLPATVDGAAISGFAHTLEVASAQVKTAILLAGLGADGETWVHEPVASRDHTERLLPAFGAEILRGEKGLGVRRSALEGTLVEVPGDPSSAAFFAVAAALVPGAQVRLVGVGTNPTRTGVLDVLEKMGAHVGIEDVLDAAEPLATWVCRWAPLTATTIQGEVVPRAIDEIPILAVAAALADGTTTIRDAQELRVKESDRLARMAHGLRQMGAEIEELPDGLVVHGGQPLQGTTIDAGMDHRIAMAFAVAGLVADGTTVIEGAEWADISFPGFFQELGRLAGGCVRVE